MSNTGRKLRSHPRVARQSASTDFCDFQMSEIQERISEEDVIDSDIEDAIYASVYFDGGEEGAQGQEAPSSVEGGLGGDQEGGWSISFTEDASERKTASSPAGKAKKRRSKGKLGLVKEAGTATADNTSTSDCVSDFVLLEEYSAAAESADDGVVIDLTGAESANNDEDVVIDLTGEAAPEVVVGGAAKREGEFSLSKVKKKKKRGKKGKGGKKGLEGLYEETSGRQVASAESTAISAEEDIRKLFSAGEGKATPSSSSPSSSPSSASASASGKSSVESGELAGSSRSSSRSKVSSDMELCSNGSMEGEEKVDDPWKINEKDRLGAVAYERLHGGGDSAGRYYGQRQTKCSNCKQRGHAASTCPWPKRHTVCYLCSEVGHVSSSCPKSLCSYCFREKHRGSSCSVPWASTATRCTRCYMRGHHASICPDHWRQFHHTTYETPHLVTFELRHQRRSDKVFCSNCASTSHFGFECTRNIPRGNTLYHLPLIASYDHAAWPPRDFYRINIIGRVLASREKAKTSNTSNTSNTTSYNRSDTNNTSNRTPATGSSRDSRTHSRMKERAEEPSGKDRTRKKPSPSPSSSYMKREQNRKKKRQKGDADSSSPRRSARLSLEDGDSRESLLITVKGRRDSSQLPDHTPPVKRPRPSGFPALPEDFPREPHHHHGTPHHGTPHHGTPHHGTPPGSIRSRLRGLESGGGRGRLYDDHISPYTPPPPPPPPHHHHQGGRGWYNDAPPTSDPTHRFPPLSRSLSMELEHPLMAHHQHHRRFSEHTERHHDHAHHSADHARPYRQQRGLMATPTYPSGPGSGRGRLYSNRGFEMSVEAARRYGVPPHQRDSHRSGGSSTDGLLGHSPFDRTRYGPTRQ